MQVAPSTEKKKAPSATADFTADVPAASPFAAQPAKCVVDSAQTKDVVVTFTPPKDGLVLGKLFETSARFIVRGDASTTYTTLLKAFIVK